MKRIMLALALCAAAVVLRAGDKQKVVAVYEFGCIVDLSKGPDTRIEVPVDEYGVEHREKGIIRRAHVTYPNQGKGGTPSPCAILKIVHEDEDTRQ